MTEDIVYAENFFNGEFESSDVFLDSFNPATGQVWAKIPDSNGDVVNRAVFAAKNAFGPWAAMGYTKRANYMLKVADLLEKRMDEFALAESRDQGKPVVLARTVDIPRAVHNFRSFAESWNHLVETSAYDNPPGTVNYSTRSPLGVAALISPWNLPMYLLTFKIAPALIAGNTVVCKPSEMTTVTAWMLAKLFKEVNLPKGVFNLVCGTGPKAGESLVRHPDTRIISFTGSTPVGERIAGIAAPMMKKLSLELGGKNPAIIFDDADTDKVVPTLIRSCFINQGEVCLCTSRVFIQETIFDHFVQIFVEEVKKLTVGDPNNSDTFTGALISKEHKEKVLRYIRYAMEDGGKILCGETVSQLKLPSSLRGGYFCQPTVIVGLSDHSRCMQEEIFGPVACLVPFKTEEEVIARANDVNYGLCASVWSENSGKVHRVAAGLEVGTVWINCWLLRNLDMPFGGTKGSGTGREGTIHSLEIYTEEKTVCLKIK